MCMKVTVHAKVASAPAVLPSASRVTFTLKMVVSASRARFTVSALASWVMRVVVWPSKVKAKLPPMLTAEPSKGSAAV